MKLLIDKPIGLTDAFAEWYGEPQMCFGIDELDAYLLANPEGDILIELRSPGGSVEQGLMIYDKLRNSGRKVVIEGYQLSSIASIIFLAGDERNISANATPVLHHPALMPWDLEGRLTSNDLDAIAEAMKSLEDRMMAIYTERMGLDEANAALFWEKLQSEWTMTADDAIMWGLATSKIQPKGGQVGVKAYTFSDRIAALHKEKTQSFNMNLKEEFDKLKAEIKAMITPKAKAGSVTTTNETVSVLYFEGDQLESGKAVFSDEAMTTPAPASVYEIDGGIKVTVEDKDGQSVVTTMTEGEDVEAIKAENAKLKEEMEAMKKEKAEAEAAAAASAKKAEEATATATALVAKVEAFEKLIPGEKEPRKAEAVAGKSTAVAERVEKTKKLIWG